MSMAPAGTLEVSALPAEVRSALRAAFGTAPIEELAPLGGGLSTSTLFSFTAGGAEYVLRKGDAERAPHAIACMRIASERGVAPRLHYADARTGVAIMDRVSGAPLGRSTLAAPTRREAVAATLRRLHHGPAFPRGPDRMDILRGLDRQHAAATGHGLPVILLRTVEELAACTAGHAHAAPCHNDLNPNNVLVTPDRVYFVDWDTASAGDPFIDLAQLGVFAFPAPDQRHALLEAYVGRRPTDEEHARAVVARVLALAFYAAAFFMVRARIAGPPARAEAVPLAQLLRELATSRERADPGAVAASLLLEMQRESAAHAFAGAKARLG